MTLSEVSTLCPAPDGWREWSEVYSHMWSTGSSSPRAVVFVEVWTGGFRVRALTDREDHYITTSEADLPAAYLRALQAVGLAPDVEKEDLRRRLTWTSEVPTTPGLYAVVNADHTPVGVFVRDGGKPCWLGHDGRRHPGEFPDGARFCPCPQPPKET